MTIKTFDDYLLGFQDYLRSNSLPKDRKFKLTTEAREIIKANTSGRAGFTTIILSISFAFSASASLSPLRCFLKEGGFLKSKRP